MEEKNIFESAAQKIANLIGNKEMIDLQAKADLNASILRFIENKKLKAEEIAAFKAWLIERIRFYRTAKNIFLSHTLNQSVSDEHQRSMTLKNQADRQAAQVQRLNKILNYYGVETTLSQALFFAANGDPLVEKPQRLDDIFFILDYFQDLEITRPIFFITVAYGTPAAVDYFIQHKAKINEKDQDGRTALHIAARLNPYPEVISLLLKADNSAQLNARSDVGNTPLHEAALNPNIEILNRLLDAEADATIKNEWDRLTLFHAVVNPNINAATLERLLQATGTALINTQDMNNATPLYNAVGGQNQNIEVVKILLKAGADVSLLTNPHNFTVLHEAIAKKAPLETIRLLVEADLTLLNKKSKGGFLPLHFAVNLNSIESIMFLIQADGGAQVNSKTNRNPTNNFQGEDTPLHLAIHSPIDVIEALLDAGANPLLKNLEDKTPYALLKSSKRASPSFNKLVMQKISLLRKAKKDWKKTHP